MFRQVNFTREVDKLHMHDDRADVYDPDKNVGPVSRLDVSGNYPDSETSNKNIFYIHGYNVFGTTARGNQAEIFKKLFWSGSRAKFWAVTWYGWHTKDILWDGDLESPVAPSYHINVMHAFDTANLLFNFIKSNIKGETSIIAHSLGNMVAASLLSDWKNEWDQYNASTSNDVPKISNYFMLDAAVATEAYDGGAMFEPHMVPATWENYSSKLYSTEWYTLFEPTDERRKLTWRDRFLNRPDKTVYTNFYSTGEDVLDKQEGILQIDILKMAFKGGQYAWEVQEKLKARLPLNLHEQNTAFGWSIDSSSYPVSTDVANQLPTELLKKTPFFQKGDKDGPLFTDNPGDHVKQNLKRLLGEALPARTMAAGKNEILTYKNNIDMQSQMKTIKGPLNNRITYWPAEREDDVSWKHNDMRDMAYLYVYNLFEEMVRRGKLKE